MSCMLGGAAYHRAIGEIVTERLLLRPFEATDLAGLVAYRSDPDVAAYQSWDPGYSTRDAERFLAEQRGLARPARGVGPAGDRGP